MRKPLIALASAAIALVLFTSPAHAAVTKYKVKKLDNTFQQVGGTFALPQLAIGVTLPKLRGTTGDVYEEVRACDGVTVLRGVIIGFNDTGQTLFQGVGSCATLFVKTSNPGVELKSLRVKVRTTGLRLD